MTNTLFTFRVVVDFDPAYKIIVARCLETGSVATADSAEMVMDMVRELLQDEARYAIDRRNITNLFSVCAPWEIWRKWADNLASEKLITYQPLDIKPLSLVAAQMEIHILNLATPDTNVAAQEGHK